MSTPHAIASVAISTVLMTLMACEVRVTREALDDIAALTVAVSGVDEESERAGLTESFLRSEVVARLEALGVTVLAEGQRADVPVFVVHVLVSELRLDDEQVVGYHGVIDGEIGKSIESDNLAVWWGIAWRGRTTVMGAPDAAGMQAGAVQALDSLLADLHRRRSAKQ